MGAYILVCLLNIVAWQGSILSKKLLDETKCMFEFQRLVIFHLTPQLLCFCAVSGLIFWVAILVLHRRVVVVELVV